jgi:hypothetical protein
MTIRSNLPPVAIDQQPEASSALASALHVAFIAMVAVGALTGTGLVFWLLSLLANSSYGLYFGI